MKIMNCSVSLETNTRELLRVISLATVKNKDLVVDNGDLGVLHDTIEMLLNSYIQPPFAHPDR